MNDKAKQLAMVLQAIEDAEREMADYRTDYKARMERLLNSARILRNEILTGQESLPIEAA